MRKSILVVEDDKSLQNAILMKLKSEGINGVPASSFKEAIAIMYSGVELDAVWLDHYLFGEGDGIDVLKKFKTDKRYEKIPIFVVTNTVTPEKIKPYFELGAEKFYVKADYRLDDIVNDIKTVWSKKI